MENPIKIYDLGLPLILGNLQMYIYIYIFVDESLFPDVFFVLWHFRLARATQELVE